MKEANHSIMEVVTYIINNSLKYGIFPEQLKLAEIKPIYKQGDPDLFENHRPLSILPSFSKMFELAFCEQIVQFMKDCNLFDKNQHGYMEGKSTKSAVFDFTNNLINILEINSLGLGIFLDLSKAYDCINTQILLAKIEKYGIRGNALKWVESYMSNRNQRVCITNEGIKYKSNITPIKVGIPQGSIIGPILFILYLNDLYTNNSQQFTVKIAVGTNLLLLNNCCWLENCWLTVVSAKIVVA